MTQMLLFDAATNDASLSPVVAVAPVSAVRSNQAGYSSETAPVRDITEDHKPGLNHMGDLARLVLLRHDLVAARRAKRRRAKRRRAK